MATDAYERFWEKVDRSGDDCWRWTACLNAEGYGKFRIGGEARLAHRVAYELFHSKIGPLGLDHLCHNIDPTCEGGSACRHRACVNPSHLEPADHRENASRSPLIGGKTHCKQGHKFSAANTSITRAGARRCLTCHREGEQRRRLQRRAAA